MKQKKVKERKNNKAIVRQRSSPAQVMAILASSSAVGLVLTAQSPYTITCGQNVKCVCVCVCVVRASMPVQSPYTRTCGQAHCVIDAAAPAAQGLFPRCCCCCQSCSVIARLFSCSWPVFFPCLLLSEPICHSLATHPVRQAHEEDRGDEGVLGVL